MARCKLSRTYRPETVFLPYDEPDLCNDYILKDLDYTDRFCINFICCCVLGQIPLGIDLLDNVVLWKEVVRRTKKSRSVGPHKLKPEKTTSKKKTGKKNKKVRSVNIQIPEKPRSMKIQMP